METLFSGFKAVSAQQWKDQIVKDLKGIDFEQLRWHTANGFAVNPFYTSEDITSAKTPLFNHHDWDICEHLIVTGEKQANALALRALEGGASGLVFHIHKAIDTAVLIKDISLEHICTQFFISNDALHVLSDLKAWYGKVNPYDHRIKCYVNIDPLHLFALYGEWHDDAQQDFSVLDQLLHIPADLSLYQEAGATIVNELAIGLAHVNEYLHHHDVKGTLAGKSLHITSAVGSDFFTEIAKLRALRKLLSLLQQPYGTDLPLHLHVNTTHLNKSSMDAYTNMLRTSTEGMSAVIGGCNSLCVLPFKDGFEEATSFSGRISRNQQHLYKEESYLNKVADMATGSYYIETLTDELAGKAWKQFQTIEANGGFIAGMSNGSIQQLIETDAAELQNLVNEGKVVLVGVNKYENKAEEKPEQTITKQINTTTKGIKPITPIRLASHFEMAR